MLEIFKQDKNFLTRVKEKRGFKYQLLFDSNGAYLEVVDSKGKSLGDVDYRVYNGVDREILKLLQEAKEESFFTISWEDEEQNIYLKNFPKLIELLRYSDKLFVDDVRISFERGVKSLSLLLEEKGKKIVSKLSCDGEVGFKFIDSSYILIGEKIVQINDVGENFTKIGNFNTTINEDKVEEFLTILATHFQNIDIKYQDFKTIEYSEKKLVTPAVIFESITQDNELVLKISASLGALSPDFFASFNINRLALLSEIEKKISIYECDFSEVFEIYSDIYKSLSSIKRATKDASFSEEDGLFIVDEAIAVKFIQNNLHTILGRAEIFGSEKLKAYKYNTSKPTLSVKFKDKIDFLDTGDATVSIGDEEFNVLDLIKLFKKNSYIPLSDGNKAIIDKSYISKLERIFKKDGSKIKVSFFDLPEIEELIAQKEQKVFKDSRKFYEGFNALKSSKFRLPKLNATLRSYQKEGFKWLKYLYDSGFGGCLADDMGLGKTLQAIALLSTIYPKEKKPSLIIMPKSLLSNWQNELRKFNDKLSFYAYYGTSREIDEIGKHQIILSSYAIVRNDIKKLKELEFDTIILDESQNIKNIESKMSKAVMLLNAKHKFALSGTPIENSLFELYSLFRFINNGMFGSVNEFKRDFVVPIQSMANEEVAKVLRAKITPFLLRRLKGDVLKDLPPKQEQVIFVDMDEEHKKFYEKRRDYYKQILEQQIAVNGIEKSRFVILQAFNDLRQIASVPSLKSDEDIESSKIDTLFEMLSDIVSNGHKVLIFANFLGAIDAISGRAEELQIEHLIMTGATRDREALVQKFQNDDKYKMMLMTLKVGGVGLNLTKADYVFIFDPWWNKAAESQAIDRAHRIGQKNRVFAYKMITKGTIEEKILELQTQKQDMTDMVISGDESGLKQLSQADLEFILG